MEKFLFSYSIPVVKLDGEKLNLSDELVIDSKNNVFLYAFPYNYSIDDGNKLALEKKYNYFMFNALESHGTFFDSVNAHYPRKMEVDSLLNEKAFKMMFFLMERMAV